jgi:hypothetical protein
MMIRVNDDILEFNDSIEVDKNIKLFDDIEEATGDFSYAFTIPSTAKNRRLLGLTSPDAVNKSVYQYLEADILGDDGIALYKGSIVTERQSRYGIECSFFSGNHNWFAMIDGPLQDYYLDGYDRDLTKLNIQNTWNANEGLIYTLMDAGILSRRPVPFLKPSDFVGGIFVKTVFSKIFSIAGIKLKGELFSDPIFNSLITYNNQENESQIRQRSVYALKTTTETRPVPPPITVIDVNFEDTTTYPYFNGGNFILDGSGRTVYRADVKMLVRVEVTLYVEPGTGFNYFNLVSTAPGSSNVIFRFQEDGSGILTGSVDIVMEPSEEIYIQTGVFINEVRPGSTLKVTPLFIWYTPGRALVPNWTKREFVNEMLKIFNTVTSYDPVSKELTINLVDKLKHKTPSDISEFVDEIEFDYTTLGQSFGKSNYFTYQEGPDGENFTGYKSNEFVKYGSGAVDLDNDNLQDAVTLVESKFSSPLTYVHKSMLTSLERVDLISESIDSPLEFTAVTAGTSYARMTVALDADIEQQDRYQVGDIIRVTQSTGQNYLGDWEVSARGDGYVEFFMMPFEFTATGEMERVRPAYSASDDSFIFINAGIRNVSDISPLDKFYFERVAATQVGFSFFNLLSNGTSINDIFKQSLKFGPAESPLDYQTNMVDNYFGTLELIMNDPVTGIMTAHIPKKFFIGFSYLTPVVVKYDMSSSLWFISKISGYKGSEYECEVELIKLS